jgi:phosphoribosyl-dephospho-CoA transferase
MASVHTSATGQEFKFLTLGSARDYKEILIEIERTSGAGRLMS